MKAEIKITDITNDDLVNLLSAASYGSSWLGLKYDSIEYQYLLNKSEWDSIEDKMAKLLLAGKSIELYDMYCECEDEFYGTLPHHYDDDGDMRYTVKLEDIKKGLESAYMDSYGRKCINDLIDDDGFDLDLPKAEYLIQIILFGEEIYG